MSRRDVKRSKTSPWAAMAVCALVITRSVAAAPALEEVAAGVSIDVGQISVSGISSGGFMAHQFHVAHSDHVMGAGIVAGGPYYCAKGKFLNALTRCSQIAMLQCIALKRDPKRCEETDLVPKNNSESQRAARASFDEAKKQEAAGNISKLANLADDKIYLFSGAFDAIVPHGVMDDVFHFYVDPTKAGVDAVNIDYNGTFPARHTMVRDSFDKPAGDVVGTCPLPPAPSPPRAEDVFIDDCEGVAEQHRKDNGCVCPPSSASGAARGRPVLRAISKRSARI